MRDAVNWKTKSYSNAAQPTRAHLLVLYDLMIENASVTTFRINDHLLESRAELETYPLGTVDQIFFSVTWRTVRGEVFTNVSFRDGGDGSCHIGDDRHPNSLAVLALSDEMFTARRASEPINVRSMLGSPTKVTDAPAVDVSRRFVARMWDEAPQTLLKTIASIVTIVVAAFVLWKLGIRP